MFAWMELEPSGGFWSRPDLVGTTDEEVAAIKEGRLGEERAEAVRLFMNQQGVALNRMSTISYGGDSPVASNRTRAGRAGPGRGAEHRGLMGSLRGRPRQVAAGRAETAEKAWWPAAGRQPAAGRPAVWRAGASASPSRAAARRRDAEGRGAGGGQA